MWVGGMGGFVVGGVGKGVMDGGGWGSTIVCFGWCVYCVEVDGLVTPEGGDDHVPVRYVEFLKVLQIVVSWENRLYDQSNSSVCVDGWCGAMLAMVVDGDEILTFSKVSVNGVLKVGNVGGVVCS